MAVSAALLSSNRNLAKILTCILLSFKKSFLNMLQRLCFFWINLALSWKFQLFCKNYNEIDHSSRNMFEKYFLQDIHYNLYGILSESVQYNRLQRLNERRIYHKSGYEYRNCRNDFSNTLWKKRYNILKNFWSSVSIL